MQAKFIVDLVGPSVSVQDDGRAGGLRFGVSRSGAMDRLSFHLANAAINNALTQPAIEISLGGLSLSCIEGRITAAIAGGHFNITLNDQTIPAWTIFTLTTGDRLRIKSGPWGSWCYLAFAGQLNADRWLDSCSVHLNSGVCGEPLKQNDQLSVNDARVFESEPLSLLDADSMKPEARIRAVLGPQQRFFAESDQRAFFNNEYAISGEYDRMGMRLTGHSLPVTAALDMPSEPISRGSVQVPGHGDPICLLADHHTAGGYPKIATVISADQDKLVQLRTGDTVRFGEVTTAEAVSIARGAQKEKLSAIELLQQNRSGMAERLMSSNLISGAVSATRIDTGD